jgi:ATPase subunit of ABC transporter with duplicated ATPase domains
MAATGELARSIDTIERGYEYLLAYAAQGRQDDAGSGVREALLDMHAVLGQLGERLRDAIAADSAQAAREAAAFLEAVVDDARKARGAIALVLSRPAIGSLLVDNLNASIHLRALLTDLFLAEQALRQR